MHMIAVIYIKQRLALTGHAQYAIVFDSLLGNTADLASTSFGDISSAMHANLIVVGQKFWYGLLNLLDDNPEDCYRLLYQRQA